MPSAASISHKKRRSGRHTPNPTRSHKTWLYTHAPLILVLLGLSMTGLSTLHTYLYNRALSFNQQLVAQYQKTENLPKPVQVRIGNTITVGVTETVYTGSWTIPPTTAAHVAQSANPGQSGNIIIYGHNKPTILGKMRFLQSKELIFITTEDGSEYVYQITGTYEVDPDQTKFLEPTDTETLTIYTCSGLLDSKRFILRAKPIKE